MMREIGRELTRAQLARIKWRKTASPAEIREYDRVKNAEYRAKFPEKMKALCRAWREAHPKSSTEWARKNPEKHRKHHRDWYYRNLDKARALARASMHGYWAKMTDGARDVYNAKRRARYAKKKAEREAQCRHSLSTDHSSNA